MQININDRVCWIEYSHDGNVVKSGFGTVLEKKDILNIIILCDNGAIKPFPSLALELYEDWD